MTDVVKKTTDGVLTILIWPVRILVILNTLIIPVLLGLIIYFYLKHQNEINDIIKRTKTIQGIIENNIQLGIDIIRENIDSITPDNINKFISYNLRDPLMRVLVNYYNGSNDYIKSISIDYESLDNIRIYFVGKISEIKNIQDLVKTTVNTVLENVIPQIINALKDVIKKELNDNDIDVNIKLNELKELLEKFSNDSNNTFAYILTQYKLFLDK